MLFFLHHGYRVIAQARRGHGRSARPSDGNDMDHYADDLADLTAHLDLHDAIHIGHSPGGEVARYLGPTARPRGEVVLVSAVTPSVLQTDANPAGCPGSSRASERRQRRTARVPPAVASGPPTTSTARREGVGTGHRGLVARA